MFAGRGKAHTLSQSKFIYRLDEYISTDANWFHVFLQVFLSYRLPVLCSGCFELTAKDCCDSVTVLLGCKHSSSPELSLPFSQLHIAWPQHFCSYDLMALYKYVYYYYYYYYYYYSCLWENVVTYFCELGRSTLEQRQTKARLLWIPVYHKIYCLQPISLRF